MDFGTFSPALVLMTVVSLALAPFVAVMVTSFTKIVVVLSLLRNALGLQQVPPNVVINGLAIVLSIYVMYPVILDTHGAVTARMAGQPPPASVQADMDARAKARAAREARRGPVAPMTPAGTTPPAAPPAPSDPPPASPAAADALQAEAEAQARAAAAQSASATTPPAAAAGAAGADAPPPARGPLFANVVNGSEAGGDAAGDATTAGVDGETITAPAAGATPAATPAGTGAPTDAARIFSLIEAGREPLRGFLIGHSRDAERAFFLRSAQRLLPVERRGDIDVDDFIVVVPAFTVSELTAAFQIGFLIFLPFLIIDLVVANILLALGMMMLSPTTVSLPFKLLLFVLIDGWAKLVHGLVLTYGGG
ncbi:MAG TPA: EscR/YscR/HrcR family type III secretion system export apparatus protein [Luteimonas sp.]|nr:EscR/YscR/HrcR family type III secretion system export apparatus protein [Luteimonas sp.]